MKSPEKFVTVTYQHIVFVADIKDLCIVKIDLLRKHGISLDMRNDQLHTKKKHIALLRCGHDEVLLWKVMAIPRAEKKFIPDVVTNDDGIRTVLLPESDGMKRKVQPCKETVHENVKALTRGQSPQNCCHCHKAEEKYRMVNPILRQISQVSIFGVMRTPGNTNNNGLHRNP